MVRFPAFPFLAFAFFVAGTSASLAASGCDAPTPTLKLDAPVSEGSFYGRWHGSWPVVSHEHVYSRCARLYISVVSAEAATVEQCLGSLHAAGLKAECKQYPARIIGDELTFTDLDGTIFSYDIADVGGMLAKRVNAEHRSVTNFTRGE